MSDATGKGKPVSLNKKADGPATTGASGNAATRPTQVLALALALLVSGLAAVGAALSLYGQHDYLVSSLTKSQPKTRLNAAVITTVSTSAGGALTTDLTSQVGQKLTASQISTEASKAAQTVKSTLPRQYVTSSQFTDQSNKAKSATSSGLGALSGTITAARATSLGAALTATVKTNLTDLQKAQLTPKQIQDKANKAPSQILIQDVVLLVALGFVARGAYAGRYWGRWAVPIIWVLASFTGTAAGFTSLLQVGSDLPGLFKVTSALSALALIVAVLLGFQRPTRSWFEAHKPALPASGAQRRGLFGPRPVTGSAASAQRPGRSTGARSATSSAQADESTTADAPATAARTSPADRARTKKRVSADATRNGADLARGRAKTASKSRRTTES